ncbi:MAG: hypothetical protein AB1473_02265 [Thermodesulfobacteriota bacterium]
MEEQKDKPQGTEPLTSATEAEAEPAPAAEEAAHETAEAAPEAPEEAQPIKENALAEKRGRMVVGGAVSVVIISVIALLVAAIFQLTSRWLMVCPSDLPVNDPAPILWKGMVSETVQPQPLGVPEKLSGEAGYKQQ